LIYPTSLAVAAASLDASPGGQTFAQCFRIGAAKLSGAWKMTTCFSPKRISNWTSCTGIYSILRALAEPTSSFDARVDLRGLHRRNRFGSNVSKRHLRR
jgi:hypothetical protein